MALLCLSIIGEKKSQAKKGGEEKYSVWPSLTHIYCVIFCTEIQLNRSELSRTLHPNCCLLGFSYNGRVGFRARSLLPGYPQKSKE